MSYESKMAGGEHPTTPASCRASVFRSTPSVVLIRSTLIGLWKLFIIIIYFHFDLLYHIIYFNYQLILISIFSQIFYIK
jgi:hypothetical protein